MRESGGTSNSYILSRIDSNLRLRHLAIPDGGSRFFNSEQICDIKCIIKKYSSHSHDLTLLEFDCLWCYSTFSDVPPLLEIVIARDMMYLMVGFC